MSEEDGVALPDPPTLPEEEPEVQQEPAPTTEEQEVEPEAVENYVEEEIDEDEEEEEEEEDEEENVPETEPDQPVESQERQQESQEDSKSIPDTTSTNDTESNADISDFNLDDNADNSRRSKRELKMLLALSKEANLNTNISHKRKTTENTKYKDLFDSPKSKKTSREGSYPVTAESELDVGPNTAETTPVVTPMKRKRDSIGEPSTGGATDDVPKKNRKSLSAGFIMFKENKDIFCWRCHKDDVNIACETCPRSYHQKCLKQTITDTEHWPCPECVAILKAESTQTRSEAMRGMDLEHLCSLLKYAAKRMIQCGGSEPFLHAVNENDFPDYKRYIIQPMDLTTLEKNIQQNIYGSTQAFEADAKWILHNCVIFNSCWRALDQSKLTSVAKTILKICKQEMAEIENCPSCYLNANTKKDTWFVEACPKPHLLLWAKLKGFPYWPAKLMCSNNAGLVDVRFFGAHDKAWVSYKDCYLYSLKDPNSYKQKRYDIDQCTKELDIYVSNLKAVFGEVSLAPFKTPLDPDDEMRQLRQLLPNYDPAIDYKEVIRGMRSEGPYVADVNISAVGSNEPPSERSAGGDTSIVGYGTDDESRSEEVSRHMRPMLMDESDDETPTSGNVAARDTTEKSLVIRRRSSDVSVKRSSSDDDKPGTQRRRNSEIDIKINRTSEVSKQNIEADDESLPLSPKKKLKITDKLIKRLSDGDKVNDKETDDTTTADVGTEEAKQNSNETDDTNTDEKPPEDDKMKYPKNPRVEWMKIDDEDRPTKIKIKLAGLTGLGRKLSKGEKQLIREEKEKRRSKSREQSPLKVQHEPTEDPPKTPNSEETISPHVENEETVNSSSMEVNNEAGETVTTEIIEPPPSVNSSEVTITRKRKASESREETKAKPIKILCVEDLHKLTDKPKENSDKENAETTPEDIEIKSEPDSSEEGDAEYMEKKRKYLSALNISERSNDAVKTNSKSNEIRTRSKTEEKANKVKAKDKDKDKEVNNVHQNNDDGEIKEKPHKEKKKSHNSRKSDASDIQVKSFAKLTTKERARKTFPTPNFIKIKKPGDVLTFTPDKRLQEKTNSTVAKSSTGTAIQTTSPSQPIVTLAKVPTSMAVTLTPSSSQPAKQPQQPMTTVSLPQLFVPPLEPIRTSVPSKTDGMRMVFLGPHSQDVVLIPSNQTITYANSSTPMFSLLPPPLTASNAAIQLPISTTTTFQLPKTSTEPTPVVTLQAKVPQKQNADADTATPPPSNILLTSLLEKRGASAPSSDVIGTEEEPNADPATASAQKDIANDMNALNCFMPEQVSRAVSDLLCRPPPKLKPRPPGALSCNFDEGLPSSAGRVTSKINSVAHKLGDYFRGLLIETIENLGADNSPEARITSLRMEIENLKHKHEIEMLEIRKNVTVITEDIQRGIAEERERLIAQTRAECELETIKRVAEAKSKQWCAVCLEEAQFYCCWNTSYCSFNCQDKHWPSHMTKCTQNSNSSQQKQASATTAAATTSSSQNRSPAQPIVLRPANPPPKHQSVGRIITSKPTKLYMNRVGTPSKTNFKQNGNHLTLVEASPGNFELRATNGVPISMSGKTIITTPTLLTKIKSGSVTLTTTNSSSPSQKSVLKESPSTDRAQVISDDEDSE